MRTKNPSLRFGNYEIEHDVLQWILVEWGPSEKHGEAVKRRTYYATLGQLTNAAVDTEAAAALRDANGSAEAWQTQIRAALEMVCQSVYWPVMRGVGISDPMLGRPRD